MARALLEFRLISGFWKLFNIPAKGVVLDECNIIKKTKWKVVSGRSNTSLPRDGNAVGNRSKRHMDRYWKPDGVAERHPFDTKEKFVRAFSVPQPKGSTVKAIPDVTSLQRFLLEILRQDQTFSLDEDESLGVAEATMKYERALTAVQDYRRTSEAAKNTRFCCENTASIHKVRIPAHSA